jgi:hypothetical protein
MAGKRNNAEPAVAAAPARKHAVATTVEIALRRDMQCGDRQMQLGDKLATVHLEPGVSLNYLVAAISARLAGEAEVNT